VSTAYFSTLGMPLVAGRDFSDRDTPTSPLVALVNEALARRMFPNGNPVGQRFRVEATPTAPEKLFEIIGLVADAKYRRMREEPRPVAFLSATQQLSGVASHYVVRSSTSAQAFTPLLREALGAVHPNLRFVVKTFDTEIQDTLLRDRTMAMLSTLLGLLAALLAAVGLHGVVSYMVERRRREIGIRLALGANRGAILGSVLRESGALVGAGLVLGVILSLGLTRSARTLLFGLQPHDAGSLLAAVTGLALVALVASYVPARRAARLDPMSTLKDD